MVNIDVPASAKTMAMMDDDGAPREKHQRTVRDDPHEPARTEINSYARECSDLIKDPAGEMGAATARGAYTDGSEENNNKDKYNQGKCKMDFA